MIGTQWYSSSVLAPRSVYWYGLLVSWPIRMVGMFCMKALMPTRPCSFGRSWRMTSSAETLSERGLSVMNMRPRLSDGLKPLAPMNDITPSTFGLRRTMSATCCCSFAIASKEMSCGASVKQKICPVSSVGRKPFGMRANRNPVATVMARNTSMTKRAVRERPLQRYPVGVAQRFESALRELVDPAVHDAVLRLEQPAGHHRREGQRYEARYQDRGDDRHRELVQQAPDDASHEEHRDEHRGERKGHRKDGERYLLRCVERGLEAGLAAFHVARDVLQHHDRVIDHEADAERERHEGNVVKAVAQARTSRRMCRRSTSVARCWGSGSPRGCAGKGRSPSPPA